VLSSAVYQRHPPDVIPRLITTRPADVLCPTDYEISDWANAGLHARSCFRLYVVTMLQEDVRVVGRLSDGDWQGVKRGSGGDRGREGKCFLRNVIIGSGTSPSWLPP